MLKGFTRRFKPLEILTEEQVEEIHRATLDVLRKTGVRHESEWALDFLRKHGCEVDLEDKRVRFPESLVEECLRRCPSSFRLKARDPEKDYILGGNAVYFGTFSGMHTIDLNTLEPRQATLAEYIEYIRVLDALPGLHLLTPVTYFGFEGVPPVMAIAESVALKFRYSGKFQKTANAKGCETFTMAMAKAVGAETKSCLCCAPPLAWDEEAVLLARRAIEVGFPVAVADGDTLGASAPATYTGSIVVANAEIISMIVLVQLLHPGHRVVVNHFDFPQDMRSGAPAFGQIGCSISNVMFNQMWRRYGIPIMNGTPGSSNSKAMDYQTGYEKALGGILAALSGAHRLSFYGSVSSELAAHPVQAIMDDDLAGMIGRFVEGATVNDETLALDLIHEVGPVPGHYLGKAHTREWWKREQNLRLSADTLPYPEWVKAGKKSCLDRAKERMEDILTTHEPKPLTSSETEAIGDILGEAREYYRKQGMISDDEWRVYMRALASPDYPYSV